MIWQDRIAERARAGDGLIEARPVGKTHMALWREGQDTRRLLVSFTTGGTLGVDGLPPAMSLKSTRTWTHLALISEGETWFRAPAVISAFDAMIDDGTFEDFERVVFYGAGSAGYAACAFSVASPGALVLALAPQATLDPARAGWDRRFLAMRRLPFGPRYGYAPDMIEAAAQIVLLHDPCQTTDTMHAALFQGRHVAPLRLPRMGSGADLEEAALRMGLTDALLARLGDGPARRVELARIARLRRRDPVYLRRLIVSAETAGHTRIVRRLCASFVPRLDLGPGSGHRG